MSYEVCPYIFHAYNVLFSLLYMYKYIFFFSRSPP